MLDVRRLRTDLDGVAAALARKHVERSEVERVAELDRRFRQLAAERDELRGRVNALSADVGAAFKAGDRERGETLRAEARRAGDRVTALEADTAAVEDALRDALLRLPNTPAVDAPDGDGDADNVPGEICGDVDAFADHQRVPHWEIGAQLGVLDLERAVRISGSMFSMFRRGGATLARALCQAALDRNADVYEEVRPPTLVLTETMTATGQLPKFADDAYLVERDGLWAIPTAEVPLTSIAKDELLDGDALPLRFMACTPCYRREAGSAGRDTRGLLRVHEFDKVELLAYATSGQAPAVLEEILVRAEGLLHDLGLVHRRLEICAGDLGQSHHRSVDLEVYLPGTDTWMEVSSVSWFSDYQARRANIRYRDDTGTTFVHTLNGSALAVPRVWAALVETHRQADGTVLVPDVLLPYFRGATTIS